MPHLRFRGVTAQVVAEISQELLEPLSQAMGCPPDWLTFEHIPASFYFQGEAVRGPSLTEVLWFDRGPETQDAVATLLTKALQPQAGEQDVAVIFLPLEPHRYYENGEAVG